MSGGLRAAAMALAALVAATQGRLRAGGVTPDAHASIRVEAGATEVELGRAFPVTVTRTWSSAGSVDDWDAAALAPLDVRLVDASRREDGDRVVEVHRYVARAFSLVDVIVEPPPFTVTTGGAEATTVVGPPLTIRVRTMLDPAEPGAPELPSKLLAEPFSWAVFARRSAAGLLLVLVIGAIVWRGLERRRPAAPVVSARERALARLRELRERTIDSAAEVEAFYVEAAALVREYLRDELALTAPSWTTEQIVASGATMDGLGDARRGLAEILTGCDQVKFADRHASDGERAELAGAIEAFVGATASVASVVDEERPAT